MSQPFYSPSAARQTAAQAELVILEPFDYAALDAGVVRQVQTAAQRIRQMVQRTLQDLIVVGNNLLAVKAALPRGSFGPWLRAEFGWSERTERRTCMTVAQPSDPKRKSLPICRSTRRRPTCWRASTPRKPAQRQSAGRERRVDNGSGRQGDPL